MMPRNGTSPKGDVLQSATRTLSALDVLSHYPDGATAKALSGDLGLNLSTTYHLLNTLVAAGYAVQDPISRHFRLGPRIPHLHQAYLTSLQPPPGIMTLLQALQESTRETVHLGRLHGWDVVVIAFVAGSQPDAVPAGYVGMGGPAHATAIGQAVLASLPPPLLERYLAEGDLSAVGVFPASDARTLRRELELVRERGYAVDHRTNGIVGCLAAPVSREDGVIPDAISIMAPRSRFLRDEATLQAAITVIAQAASTLGSALRVDDRAERIGSEVSSALAQAFATLRPHRLAAERR